MLNKRGVNVGNVNISVSSGGESLSEVAFSHQTAVSHWIVALVKDTGSGDPGERCGWPQRAPNTYLIRPSSRCPGSAGADSDVNSL